MDEIEKIDRDFARFVASTKKSMETTNIPKWAERLARDLEVIADGIDHIRAEVLLAINRGDYAFAE